MARTVTEDEFNLLCDFWYKQNHLTQDEKNQDCAVRHTIGTYHPKTMTLNPWNITPSSEDKGFSTD